jgi:hypothetical protein
MLTDPRLPRQPWQIKEVDIAAAIGVHPRVLRRDIDDCLDRSVDGPYRQPWRSFCWEIPERVRTDR